MIQDIFPHRFNNHYRTDEKADDMSLIVFFGKDGLLVKEETEKDGSSRKLFPRLAEFSERPRILTYLFTVDDDRFFLSEDECISAPSGYREIPVREIRRTRDVSKKGIFEAFTARQLDSWYRNNRYCGRCGSLTGRSLIERAIVCGSCGNTIYPKVVPAVIVGVLDPVSEKIVLTMYNGRGTDYYALVAGFTEIGETLEETVAREVMEEVGLHVKNIRYYKSQPWGVADDILTGFFCEVDGDRTIKMDKDELSVAEWKSREEVVLQPDDLSLTNEMMKVFAEGRAFSYL